MERGGGKLEHRLTASFRGSRKGSRYMCCSNGCTTTTPAVLQQRRSTTCWSVLGLPPPPLLRLVTRAPASPLDVILPQYATDSSFCISNLPVSCTSADVSSPLPSDFKISSPSLCSEGGDGDSSSSVAMQGTAEIMAMARSSLRCKRQKQAA